MSVDTSFEFNKLSYTNRWNRMLFTGSTVINRATDKILKNKARYQKVEALTGVPWWFTGILHIRESSGNFNTYLGNGQSLNKKTTITPKGRGPFKSFEVGAYAAYKIMGYLKEKDWSLEHALYLTEKYNGFGYMRMGKASPYVWGLTNIAGLGKYIKDDVYSPTAKEAQPGTAAILRRLMDLDPSIKIGPKKRPQDVVQQPIHKSGVAVSSITGGAAVATAGISSATDAINSVNQLKDSTHKLGIFDGLYHVIAAYPLTSLALAVALTCASFALYSRLKAKWDTQPVSAQ